MKCKNLFYPPGLYKVKTRRILKFSFLANVVCFWCQYIFISLHLGNRLDFNFQGIIWILISRESFGLLVGTTNSSIAELKTSQYQYQKPHPTIIINVHKMCASTYTRMLGKFSRCSREIFFQTLHIHNVHAMF